MLACRLAKPGSIKLSLTRVILIIPYGSKSKPTLYVTQAQSSIPDGYIESLDDPNNDPLNLWMTGGPGCSGLIGMMMELGPCLINTGGNGTHRNPYSWTTNSSMIFVDQPAGTGFSYVDDKADLPGDSFMAASDMYVFLQIFYNAFPSLKEVPFHISGESYGGHYVPTVAAEIVRYNTQRVAPEFVIPLKSIMIGDGFVSPMDTTFGYYETLCKPRPGQNAPVFNETRCNAIAEALPRCMYVHEACYDYPDPLICQAADSFCMTEIRDLFDSEVGLGGRDPFDVTRTCEIDQFCYLGVIYIETYINNPKVWAMIDPPKAVSNYSIMSFDIVKTFLAGADMYVNTAREVRYVLEEGGVDVLIYNGNLDLACNTPGNLRWMERLSWKGQAEFVAQSMEQWQSPRDGELVVAGTMKEVKAPVNGGDGEARLAFVTVDEAGHMVPLDQPEMTLYLIQKWMNGESI
ncbi:hypothetical protein G7046_g4025 [Stylonectria norvegica]|nr:hypothetical protein G7046_g4025 [Stylonectria norvegica]